MTIAIPTPTSIFQECPFCKGTGVLKSVESMVLDVIRLLQMACQRADITSVEVNVHPEVADVLLNEKQAKLQELEDTGKMRIKVFGRKGALPELMEFVCKNRKGETVQFNEKVA